MTNDLEQLLHAGRYQDILSLTVESPDFACTAETIPWVVGALSMMGRTEEAAGLYQAYVPTLPEPVALVTRFFYALAVCRERRIRQARQVLLENLELARRLHGVVLRERGAVAEAERLLFYAFQGLAFFRYSTGYYRQAQFWVTRSLSAAVAGNFHYGVSLAQELYGHILLQLGHVSLGTKRLTLARDQAARLGQAGLTQTFDAAFRLYRATFGLTTADQIVAELSESLAKCRYEDAYTKASLQVQAARVMTLTGDILEASRLLDSASSLVYSVDNPYLETNYNLTLAWVQFLRGNFVVALSIARNAETRARERVYTPAVIRALGLQCRIMERMGMFRERQSVVATLRSLTVKTGGFLARRIFSRRDLVFTAYQRGEDPLGDLLDDVAAGRRDMTTQILGSGWLSLLRDVAGIDPDQKAIVFDLEPGSLTSFCEGHVSHKPDGGSTLVRKLLTALAGAQELSKDELTQSLWGQAYNPLRHDQLIYGLIARARKNLAPFPTWIEVTEGGYRLAEGVLLKNLRPQHAPVGRVFDSPAIPAMPARSGDVPEASATQTTTGGVNLADLNFRQMEMINMASGGAWLSPRDMASHFKVSDATISRDLAGLVQIGVLRRSGAGRSTVYGAKVN